LRPPSSAPALHAPGAAWADQPAAADEKAIRELIRKGDEGERIKWSEDGIFASGLTPKPLVGSKEAQEFRAKSEPIRKQRPNSKTKTTVERLVVAKAGDLVYEYSNFRMEFQNRKLPLASNCTRGCAGNRRYEPYIHVRELHQQGVPLRQIARDAGMSRRTVRRFIRATIALGGRGWSGSSQSSEELSGVGGVHAHVRQSVVQEAAPTRRPQPPP
jgi:hypothetical protein